ncbi:TCB1 transposase, partial [Polypterus senegalus]
MGIMPRTKELSEELRLRIVNLHKGGKGYKVISKILDIHQSTVMQVIYKWRQFGIVATPPRSGRPAKMTPRAQCKVSNEVKKNPRVTAKDLKKSLELANISVHESTTLKILNKKGAHGRTPRRKPLLSKKNNAELLKFVKEHLDIPQWYWENVLWSDETKTELFGRNKQNFTWRKKGTAYQHQNIIPTVKYGGGNIMIWASFAASGPGQLAIIEGKINSQMNAAKYRDILDKNLLQSAKDFRLGRRFTFQQDNDPKHTAKRTKEWLHNNSVTVLEWPSQSPDLNQIENLWRDLKMAVHQRLPSNLTELERICKEEWQRIPKSRCEKLVASFPRRLMAVLDQKDASSKY